MKPFTAFNLLNFAHFADAFIQSDSWLRVNGYSQKLVLLYLKRDL